MTKGTEQVDHGNHFSWTPLQALLLLKRPTQVLPSDIEVEHGNGFGDHPIRADNEEGVDHGNATENPILANE